MRDRIRRFRETNRFVRADFGAGSRTLIGYLRTHRNRYRRRVGAHFLIALDEAGEGVLDSFMSRHRQHGWHFRLTPTEVAALRAARDATCARTHIANLRYLTNVFDQLFNLRQLGRMIALGAAAGSAGILIAASEIFFVVREEARGAIMRLTGIDIDGAARRAEADTFKDLAADITQGAMRADGTLDSDVVAARIETLVEAIEAGQSADAAAGYLSDGSWYVVGIVTGVLGLVLFRGLLQLAKEGIGGAVEKIDAMVSDIDAFCNWRLGRTGIAPPPAGLPGDFLLPGARILPPDPRRDGADPLRAYGELP